MEAVEDESDFVYFKASLHDYKKDKEHLKELQELAKCENLSSGS